MMLYGRYFRLDAEASFLDQGIAVFKHLRGEYRIYLTFTPESIKFFTVNNPGDAASAGNSELSMTHMLLRLPLDETLGSCIVDIAADEFDRKIDENADTGGEPTYAATFRFAAGKKKKTGRARTPVPEVRNPDEFPKRNLVLDFLFDFSETDVFRMSPRYSDVAEKLRQSFFARCLLAKASCCYRSAFYANILKETRKTGASSDRKSRRERNEFYGENYFKSELEWTECIRDPRSDKAFHDSNGWFDASEKEMKNVYRPWTPIELDKHWREEEKENDERSSKWFVARYVWWFPMLESLFHPSFRGLHLFMPRLLFSIFAAWFSLVFIQNQRMSNVECFKERPKLYISFMLFSLFAASWITIRRTLPLSMGVFRRTVNLTLLVIILSFLLGRFFKIDTELFGVEFAFYWGSAAILGMVIQLVLSNQNPSEPF